MLPEERLTQAEKLLETAARYIDRHSQAISRHDEAIRQHDEQMIQINSQMARLIDLFTELTAIARQNQEENRRIWEYLLSQQGNGKNPN